ncbi:MFS transporter [Peterkaempfera bronchialis]|uniref:MFS transporter n=1 Tax=Peterkaempfera bronchialis TaxID=2126346 RepID=A0A345SSD9_9ACTN|nr:MFS transporter [Peterkaempfera bronchialis]AXI76644.1 MFS transporter [Peterkaempfera bronchialis]
MSTTTAETAPPPTTARAGRRAWLGLALLALPTLLVGLDMNVLFLALPRLTADLRPSGTEQLWITDSYGFMTAGFVITMGTLGDRIGRRRLLLIGAAGFGAASVLAAFSTGTTMLIAARLLLGLAGAALMPSTLALITSMFAEARQRGQAISIWATCNFTSAAVGPVLGGFLLEHFWWGSVFLVAAPVMLLVLVAGPVLLPEFRNPDRGRLDPVSVALSMAAVLPIVYGIKRLAVPEGGGPTLPVAAIVVGAGVGALFVRRQLHLATPLLDLRLFRNPTFTAVLCALVLAGVVMAGTGLLGTQFLQSVLDLSPTTAALWFAPMGLGVGLGTMLAPALGRRLPLPAAIAVGLACSVPGCLLITQVGADGRPLPLAVGVAVLALGTGPLFALGTGVVVGAVPAERAGSAASMSETSNFLGGSLGMALLGAAGTGLYQQRMAGPVADAVSAGLPEGAAHQARETLAGAVGAAHRLPDGAAADLLRAAHDAFTGGLHLAGVTGAVVFAGLSVWFLRLHRRSQQG